MKQMENVSESIGTQQRRCTLPDPQEPHTYAVSNIIIYSSFYYPSSKQLLLKVVKQTQSKHLPILSAAIAHLYSCLQRQVISGPSSSYFPPSQLPTIHHQDSLLLLQTPNQDKLQKLRISIQHLGLQNLFEETDLSQLSWYNCQKFLSLKRVQNYREGYKAYSNQLDLQGESFLETTPFAYLFCTLSFLLERLLSNQMGEKQECNLRLLWARLSFLHNKSLKNPVKKLSEIIVKCYKRVLEIKHSNVTLQDYIQLLLEYSYALLFYYKYNQAEAILRHCSRLLQMKIEFTGKLGRRTKYQQFDTPQLIMTITNNQSDQPQAHPIQQNPDDTNDVSFIDAKALVARSKQVNNDQKISSIKASTYDEESILLQTPKFVQDSTEASSEKQKTINQHHLLVTLAIIYFEWRSSPHEQMQYQNISASVMTLQKFTVPTSFSYNFSLLLLRSLNEFSRIKHAQRALDQFEKLRTSFNGETNKGLHNLYSTPYEPHLSYILILADKYLEIGLSLTAIQLFEQAGLYEECIDVLIQKQYKEKALEMINKLIDQKGKNPRLLCMLGDIYKDQVKYYEQAWLMSKERSSRAMRSLGWVYFYRKDFEKAAECFLKATQVSYYHPNTWFTLGCCYMRSNQYEKALRAFGQCVSIDETQGEAWGNIASCYMHQKKMKQAYSSLDQAVKYSESNWMLWANLISVSLVVKKFYKYFQAIERIVALGHQEVVTEEVLRKVVQIMSYKNESGDRKRIIFNYRNRINRLFDYLQHNIGENPVVWRGRSLYQIQIIQYFNSMNLHYNNLHTNSQLDQNDLVPGYETAESTLQTTHDQLTKAKKLIVTYKQTQLNMRMRVGWHENKLECTSVKQILLDYIKIYRQYSDLQDKEEMKLFIKGVWQKICHCLEETAEMNLEWLN